MSKKEMGIVKSEQSQNLTHERKIIIIIIIVITMTTFKLSSLYTDIGFKPFVSEALVNESKMTQFLYVRHGYNQTSSVKGLYGGCTSCNVSSVLLQADTDILKNISNKMGNVIALHSL